METIIKHYLKTVPFPFLDKNGNICANKEQIIPIQCKSCLRQCKFYFKGDDPEKIRICPNGFNVYKAQFKSQYLAIIGILIKGKHGKLPRKAKKNASSHMIDIEELTTIEAEINNLLNEIEEYKEFCVKDSLAVYHDITPTISLIFRSLESIIEKEPGFNFEDKVENADSEIRTLYHAINLLDNRLKMMPLISNPEAARYGQVSKCSPYKIFDKIRRIFNDSASKKGITIDLRSDSYITLEPLVYDSFLTIPFVLVENAIKYSKNNGTIYINLKQRGNEVIVKVTSYGPVVTVENQEKIFEKGFKDPNAKKFASQGSGIGLYLANIVASAHNLEISYQRNNIKIEKGIEMGSNTFSFQLTV